MRAGMNPVVVPAKAGTHSQSFLPWQARRLWMPAFAGMTKQEESAYSKASSQLPCVAALEYSVARFSKKLACSTPLSISSIQGRGFFSIR